jgi:hypothetical protein
METRTEDIKKGEKMIEFKIKLDDDEYQLLYDTPLLDKKSVEGAVINGIINQIINQKGKEKK